METKRPTNPLAEELIGLYHPILDFGFIGLKDYSGTDKCIEEAARVSYSGGGTRKTSETRGLLRYMSSHAHTSPFELVQLKFHISCPIFVMRQHIRHRVSSTSELSGRYSLMPLIFYTPSAENFSRQSKSNKQGRSESIEIEKYNAAVSKWNEIRKESSQFYQDLAAEDVARELCRIDLPTSTYTSFYWSIDLHNLFHYLSLRCDGHAQFEIREYANVMAGIVKAVAPLSFEAWIDYQFCSTKFSRQEMNILEGMLSGGYNLIDGNTTGKSFKEYGLSDREIKEFSNKLKPKQIPNFDLDLCKAKSAEYFEKIIQDHTPVIDSKPQGI